MEKEKIKELFDNNPSADKLIITSDDQAFEKRNDATYHASTLVDKKTTTVFKSDYVGVKEEAAATNNNAVDSGVKLNAEERIAKINACTTADEVEALLVGEKAKTVLAAGDEKIASFE